MSNEKVKKNVQKFNHTVMDMNFVRIDDEANFK